MEPSSVREFVEGRCYNRAQIGRALDVDARRVGLPTKDGKVKCAIMRKDRDVAPPDVILVGASKDRFWRGKALCDQREEPIPMFVYEEERTGLAVYRYCGRYEVSHWSEDSHTLPLWDAAAKGREDRVKRAVFMRKCE